VLQVDERVGRVGPLVVADAALLVVGDLFGVVRADGLHPDLKHVVVVRRQVGEALAVGGDPRGGLDGGAEGYRAGDERWQVGAGRTRASPARMPEKNRMRYMEDLLGVRKRSKGRPKRERGTGPLQRLRFALLSTSTPPLTRRAPFSPLGNLAAPATTGHGSKR